MREKARPGSRKLPDPRRFVTLEACAATLNATIGFAAGVRSPDGSLRWFESDAGLPAFRIARRPTEFPNGCFRGAVALPTGTLAQDIVALRVRAFTRTAAKGEPTLSKGSGAARLLRVNTLFQLEAGDEPGPRLFSWRGDEALQPEGAALELNLRE